MKILGVEYENPNELSLSPNNVRKNYPESNIEVLLSSVEKSGQIFEPILINTKNQIVAGQRRWIAAKKANLKEIPCIVAEFEDDKEEVITSFVENLEHLLNISI